MPSSVEVVQARAKAGLTQTEAGKVVAITLRSWQMYEAGDRNMPDNTFELFLLKTNQHPTLKLTNRENPCL